MSELTPDLPESGTNPPANPPPAGPDEIPTGRPVRKTKNAEEVDEIITFAACLLGTLKRKSQIKKLLRQRYATHHFSARSLDRYLSRARARVQKWAARKEHNILRQVRAALQAMLRLTNKVGEQLAIIDRIIHLYGLAAPSRHEHMGKDGGPIQSEASKIVFYIPDNGRGDGPAPEGATEVANKDTGSVE